MHRLPHVSNASIQQPPDLYAFELTSKALINNKEKIFSSRKNEDSSSFNLRLKKQLLN